MLTDSHLHLSFAHDKDALLKSILDSGVKSVFVSVDESSVNELLNFSKSHNIAFFAGFHPLFIHNIRSSDRQSYVTAFLERVLSDYGCADYKDNVCALCGLGEVGLDKRSCVGIKEQSAICYAQLSLAFKYKKAVSLHVVKSHDIMLHMLDDLKSEHKLPVLCVHGATLSPELIKAYKRYDAYFSFGANLIKEHVDNNIKHYDIVAKCKDMLLSCSDNKILIESDYDKEGSIYKSDFILNVYKSVSCLKEYDLTQVKKLVYNNLCAFVQAQ